MIRIRDAAQQDMGRLIEMGRLFHVAADAGDLPSFDPISFHQTATWLIDSPVGTVLVIEKEEEAHGINGMAGALVYPAWFNLASKLGQEIFWWVDPADRGWAHTPLRLDLERRMKKMGAQNSVMLSMAGMREEAMARLYRMAGYRPMEHTFIKRL